MAGTTITTIYTAGLTVSGTAQPVVSITATGGVEPAGGPAIYANAPLWSLVNEGHVSGGTGAAGIYLASGSASLANQAYIGGQTGIMGTITLQNTGLITGRTGAGVTGSGSISNRGTILGGLSPQQGDANAIGVAFATGTLTNGLIGLVRGQYDGARFSGTGTLANLGTIAGVDGTGVVLAAGGSIVNGGSTAASALIEGKLSGVSLGGGGTVMNYGQVSGFNGIEAGAGLVINAGLLAGGAALQLAIPFAGYTYAAGAGVVLAGGTLQNTGLVQGGAIPAFAVPHEGTAGAGVVLSAGLVVNHGSIAGGTAQGYSLGGGSGVLETTGTLLNDGLIAGGAAYSGGTGLSLLAGAYAQSSGTIAGGSGTFGGAGVLLQGGTLQNTGSITGGDGNSWNWAPGLAAGVDVYTGLLMNAGIITGGAEQHVGVDLGAGTVQNSGTISGATGVLALSGIIDNTGMISAVGAGVDIAAGTLVNAGTIAGLYAVYMAQAAQRLIVESGGVFLGKVAAKGSGATLELAAGTGTLDMGASFSGFAGITLDQSGTWDLRGGLAQLAGGELITGFAVGDTLELEGFSATSARYVAGDGLELSNGTTVATLDLTGSFAADGFAINADAEGTRIAICYARGTRITTAHGERLIETLRIGDALPSRFGGMRRIKWIGRQTFTLAELQNNRALWPVRIAAGALGEGLPRRALTISPAHSMLLDGMLVLAKFLVNGVTITQPAPLADVAYYLIEFAAHDCVLAEGCWAESFADGPGLRAQFCNAAEFHSLYPTHETPATITLCAPRPESGPALEAALRPLAARSATGAPGVLQGYIDIIDGRRVEGWAQDLAWPDMPQWLELSTPETVLGHALACSYRADLEAAGIGAGCAHFTFQAEADFPRTALRVRRVEDGAEIFAAAGVFGR